MKKRLIAATLGIMLTFSMGLEAGAAALDSGFSSGFTAEPESAEETQQNVEENGTEADQSAEADGSANDQNVVSAEIDSEHENTDATGTGAADDGVNPENPGTDESGINAAETVEDGFISDEAEGWTGEASTENVQNFDEAGASDTEAVSSADVQVQAASDTVFEWTEWEKTADGQFRLRKKTVAQPAAVQAGEMLQEATAEAQGETSENAAQESEGVFSDEQDQTEPVIETQSTAVEYYTAADGIVKITTRTEKGKTHTGYYLFDANGYLVTGALNVDGNANHTGTAGKYYFRTKDTAEAYEEYAGQGVEFTPWMTNLGQMFRNGWQKFTTSKGEQWCYYDSGELDSSKMGKMLEHGIVVTDLDGLKDTTGDSTYLVDKNGYIIKNSMKKASDGKYYFTDKNGCVYKNRIVTYKKKMYYVTETGAKAAWKNCWHRCPGAGNRMYYFGRKPGLIVKKTGWQKVTRSNGKFFGWFLFTSSGKHYANKLKNGYYFKADGRLAGGITVINGKSYFFKPSTSTTRDGQMVKNQMFVYKKKTYYAGADGVLRKNGWQYVDGEWYYFKDMKVVTNSFVKRNGKYGYVDATGKFSTGWVIVDNSQNLVRYINPDAKGYVTNTSKWIDGKLYYFDKNGYRINDLTSTYTGPYTLEVDRVNGVMTVYADSARTIPVKTIRVSVGNPGTETPKGTYKLTRYSRWQALMGPSWGQYGTHVDGAGEGGIFIHSIACNNANSYNLPVGAYYRLGSPASHGCIRTCVGDAKWVYENCNGSTIHIFDGTYKADEVFKGPLGRRAIVPLKGMKNGGYYDPTDPNA